MRVLLLGSSGLLGTELQKCNPDLICPPHKELDITNFNSLKLYVDLLNPDIIINAVAIKDNRAIEKNPEPAIRTNIIGAANVSMVCREKGIRLVYISTDYIYKGSRGNYVETDEIFPFNIYSWTKLGGECSTVTVKNHLIIRTSFGSTNFDYETAFTDKWSSKDYVDIIAPMIYEAATSPLIGILNLGTERKTLYEYASKRNQVKPVKISDTHYFTPYDTSLNLQKWMDYKNNEPTAKPHTQCRICGSKNLTKYLDLGVMPLANNLQPTSVMAKEQERFPLQVLFCEDCYLSQLSVVINPHRMFDNYTYRSSVNTGYVTHCRTMAHSLKDKLNENSFHIDIGGNDGTLLKQFKEVFNHKVLNVDPASNIVAVAEARGIESICDFWDFDMAEKILEKYGKADLITGTNVFAHQHNLIEFMEAVKLVLKDDGMLILEFPYLVDFIEKKEYDTIYFEHLNIMSISPLYILCDAVGMTIHEADIQDIHGGTIRVTIGGQSGDYLMGDSVKRFQHNEYHSGYHNIERYKSWGKEVQDEIKNFSIKILELKKQGKKISGFGASAKGNTLLNAAGMNTDVIDYIVDETPEKINKFSPTNGIPIVHISELQKNPPDYLIILAWNFAHEIMQKCNKFYSGNYIIPIPEFQEVIAGGVVTLND